MKRVLFNDNHTKIMGEKKMKKTLKIALVSTLTLAMAFSATLGFAATTHKKTVKHKVKAAVTYPVLTKTSATFKVTNVNKTTNVAGLKNLKVKTGSLSTAYYNLAYLVPINTVVTKLGGTVSISSTGLATFKYDGSTTTLQLKAAKGGNAYKISGVWYVNAPAIADKLVNSVIGQKVTFTASTLTFTRSGASQVANVWEGSTHNQANWEEGLESEAVNPSCAKCHNGFVYSNWANLAVSGSSIIVTTAFDDGIKAYATNETIILSGAGAEEMNIDCYVCHASDRGGNALYSGTTPALSSGIVIKGAGAGAVCMSCHEGRNKTPNYAGPSTSVAPHHSGQTDLLFGTAASGYRYPGTAYAVNSVGSPHAATPDACVGCHMSNKVDGVANHTMEINGAAACGICHNGLKSVARQAFGDYDGDKSIEPYQDEVVGLTEVVRTAIQAKVQTDIATDSTISVSSSGGKLRVYAIDSNGTSTDITWNLGSNATSIYRAGYNVLTVESDGSLGLHNPVYSIKLLQASYNDLTGSPVPNAAIR